MAILPVCICVCVCVCVWVCALGGRGDMSDGVIAVSQRAASIDVDRMMVVGATLWHKRVRVRVTVTVTVGLG